ncbi:MAG: cytochrome c3 family protein [Planctomycetota bacterium]
MRADRSPRSHRRSGALALLLLSTLALLAACSAAEHYELLSFFFDGVPDPNAPVVEPPKVPEGPRVVYVPPVPDASEMAKLHPPYAQRRCDACHQRPRDRRNRVPGQFTMQAMSGLRLPVDQLCFSCHEQQPRTYWHAPALLGLCVRCHHPHASYNDHLLLRKRVAELCEQCHTAETMVTTERHREFGDRSCAECHDPHAADVRFFLKPGSGVEGAPAEAAPALVVKPEERTGS